MSPSKVNEISWTEFYNIINGQRRSGKSLHYGVNPANKQELWPVPVATQNDVNEAVTAAQVAFAAYSQSSIDKRRDYISKLRDHWMAHIEEMTDLLILETGKPVSCTAYVFD